MRIELPTHVLERSIPEPDVCPECQGRGWKVLSDGGAGTARPCSCRRNDLSGEYLRRAGIPEAYRRCTLDSFKSATADPNAYGVLENARRVSAAYVEGFYDSTTDRYRASGLLFSGPPGTGKTHLAVAILSELVSRYQLWGRFVIFTSFVQQILQTFDERSPESQYELLEPVKKARLLVLDELGARKPSEWVTDILYDIINTRYVRRLPTIFTTNFLLEAPPARARPRPAAGPEVHGPAGAHEREHVDRSIESFKKSRAQSVPRHHLLSDRISDALLSRILEMAQPVTLVGASDYRTEIKQHRHRLGRQA